MGPLSRQAAMGLRKSFPKDRNYEFWNIAMCYLISVQSGVPEKDRMLFGTLAYRMITKAVEAIPPGQVCNELGLREEILMFCRTASLHPGKNWRLQKKSRCLSRFSTRLVAHKSL